MAMQAIDHYIPFFGRDFYASTAMWTAEEVGHYIRLLVIQWDSGSLPADIRRLELVSPGVGKVWGLLEQKFPLCDDGRRRNSRMEAHRTKAAALKAKRSESGREGGKRKPKQRADRGTSAAEANGKQTPKQIASKTEANTKQTPEQNESKTEANAKQTPKQNESKTEANGQAKGVAKTKPPSPSPSPNDSPTQNASSLRSEELPPPPPPRRAESVSTSAFPQPEDGWVPDVPGEWDRLREAWNATPGVERFTAIHFPRGDLLVNRISDPNWLRMYPEALGRLPQCRYFERPVNLAQFLGEHFVANVLCGSYDRPKLGGRGAVTPRKGTL